ncbi:hypothetical protein GCM10010172_27410 [Paractinoplanes ferrugineus]|uniref:Uncharacterized protein n=1 Tax=Paractinoplanes ferrugineus TaxID=113564 RepID=A0A919IXA5_9ACTN|nr:hypothetical protein [Actinoplanes ferrugineus]GIE08349.1 hypothetical protein Afe05nite_01890 [Actinoplanes ferrugineus]
MDRGEDALHVVGDVVVEPADPFDPESRTAELPYRGAPAEPAVDDHDPLIPPPGSGLAGWFDRFGRTLLRCGLLLLPVGLLAALPMHFFVGRVDDTVVAAPALSDLLGGFGLLLLPLMWLAYFTVSVLPLVICLAGTVAVAVYRATLGVPPRPGAVWRLVANRLRAVWLWFTPFGLLTQALPVLLSVDRIAIAPSVTVPLALALALLSTGVLTFTGMLGCVVLVERGSGGRRAMHLISMAPLTGLVVASLAVTVLPRLADTAWGGLASTLVSIPLVLLWAMASVVAYGQARRAEGPVTSRSLYAALSAPEFD